MRLLASIPLSLLSIAALAACQSEESYRAEFRGEALRNCQNGDPAAKAQLSAMGVDMASLCGCVIDGYMRSASYDQLKQDQNNPSPPGMRAQFPRCARELGVNRAAQSPPADTGAEALANAQAELDRAASEMQSQAENAAAEIEKAARE